MARKPRIEYPGAFFHIIARGNNRQDIFHDNEDRHNCLNRLAFYFGEKAYRGRGYTFQAHWEAHWGQQAYRGYTFDRVVRSVALMGILGIDLNALEKTANGENILKQ